MSYETFKIALEGRGEDVIFDPKCGLATMWAFGSDGKKYAREEVQRAIARSDRDVVGALLYEIGALAREVHDLGRTDGRLASLDRATRKLKLARSRWQALVALSAPGAQ